MPKGLPKSIIKQYGISKKAWDIFRGRKHRKVNKSKTVHMSQGKHMPRRSRRGRFARIRHRVKKMTIPIAPVAGLAAGLVPPAMTAIKGDYMFAADQLVNAYTGITGLKAGKIGWNPMDMSKGVLPLVAGALIHKYVGGKLGVNKMLAQSGVPLIRI